MFKTCLRGYKLNLQKLFAFVIFKHDGQTIQSTVTNAQNHVPPPKSVEKRKAISDHMITKKCGRQLPLYL